MGDGDSWWTYLACQSSYPVTILPQALLDQLQQTGNVAKSDLLLHQVHHYRILVASLGESHDEKPSGGYDVLKLVGEGSGEEIGAAKLLGTGACVLVIGSTY